MEEKKVEILRYFYAVGKRKTSIAQVKIFETKNIPVKEIHSDSLIKDGLGITSMEYIVVLTDIATVLDIDLMSFSESEIIKAITIGDLEDVLGSKLVNISED